MDRAPVILAPQTHVITRQLTAKVQLIEKKWPRSRRSYAVFLELARQRTNEAIMVLGGGRDTVPTDPFPLGALSAQREVQVPRD